jgi:hypothetical protein
MFGSGNGPNQADCNIVATSFPDTFDIPNGRSQGYTYASCVGWLDNNNSGVDVTYCGRDAQSLTCMWWLAMGRWWL